MSSTRVKDASFLQQHIEKLILGGGILVLVIAVFLFVIGNPFAVQVSGRSYSKPTQAVEVLVLSSERLEAGLQENKPLPEITPPKFGENFIAMMRQPIYSGRPLARLSRSGLTQPAMTPDIPEPPRYAMVYPPVPTNVLHKSGTDVLDVQFNPEAVQVFFDNWNKKPGDPADFTMFVAAGDFDIWEWVTRLQEAPPAENEIKIPEGIWTQRFGVAGVMLLRETWDPQKGIWTDRQIVEPLPGQTRFLPDDDAPVDTVQAIELINSIREAQLELAQPELPWLDGFVQVTPPGGDEPRDGEGVDGFIQSLNDENLGPTEIMIRQLEERIRQLEERRQQRDGRPGTSPSSRGPEGGFDSPGPTAGERSDPITRQIEQIQSRIEKMRPKAERERENRERMAEERRRREELKRQRDALRSERDRNQIGSVGDEFGGASVEGLELKEGSKLRVWAADPSMQPGKTYRYKLLVSVINPLYAVPRLASDQLAKNKDRPALLPSEAEVEAMDWIGPIKVEPESRFFFTGGGESRARIDIYRRVDGQLRVQDFDGSPGDRIGGVIEVENALGQVTEIDMSVDAILVDVNKRRDVLSGSTVYTMIYMDSQGNLFERSDIVDKSSPARKELTDEIKDGPERVLRPDPDANPADDFRSGEFDRF